MPEITLHHGDSRDVLKSVPDDSLDACACDPPYALSSIVKRFGKSGAAPAQGGKTGAYARASAGFMGQAWDTGEAAFDPEFWREVYRVLKPGAHLIAFGGTRTYHRLACAIEDAGFEIRDMVSWLYGSGFPKSHDVGAKLEDWEGWGTALKPGFEPVVLARKPLSEKSVARNVVRWGTGALNVDACRVEGETVTALGDGLNNSGRSAAHDLGRFPANVVHDGSPEVLAAFPETSSAGHTPDARGPGGVSTSGHKGQAYVPNGKNAVYGAGMGGGFHPGFDDQTTSAARFFYSAKADATDRLGSKHPTVKPVDLMQWCVRLITPPGGTVLDPFAGSGSTGIAAYIEGFDAVLIEREASYVPDIRRRIEWVKGRGEHTAQAIARKRAPGKLDPFLAAMVGE